MKQAEAQLSDAALVQQIKSRPDISPCVRHLYTTYFDSLHHYVINNSGSDQDAEDFFQETIVMFIDVVRRDKFRGDSSVKTFLYAILKNLWRNELKRRNRALHRETRYYEEQEETAPDVSHHLHEHETKTQLADLLKKAGEGCYKIFMLVYYREMSMEEIADEMQYKNEQIARNMHYKCKKKVHKLLDQDLALKQHFKSLLQ
jgi:RNA polymerase sigma factor (sigma-70 family)